MDLQLIRHATLRVNIEEQVLLVDPMLSDAGAMPPIANSADERRNPLVPLPMPVPQVLDGVTAVVVTHTHRDHWDPAATDTVPKHTRILCQPEDADKFHEWGFDEVRPIHSAAVMGHIGIYRTAGEHGTGEIGRAMAPVSGFVLRSRAGESMYIAGDTILCNSVRAVLQQHKPKYTIVNCGGARFNTGGPITMTAEDVVQLAAFAPFTTVIAVHMESINHCGVTRRDLARTVKSKRLHDRVLIPQDGETLHLP